MGGFRGRRPTYAHRVTDPQRAAAIAPTDADLARLARRHGLRRLEVLGGFENLLLRSDPPGRVVRLTHTSRRSVGDVEAEVAFMHHLAHHGVPVVDPVPTIDGNLAEPFVLDDGTETVAYGMTEAPGVITKPPDWSDEAVVALGDLLGRAHVAAASFDPGDGPRRPSWTSDVFDPGTGRSDDRDMVAAWRSARDRAAAHPAGGDHLLIHQDAHWGNQHVADGSRPMLFDFDDCAYGTPEHDLAIVLFYWMFKEGGDPPWDDDGAAARRLLDRLFEGYRRHADVLDDWPEGFDRILSMREADLFLIMAVEGDDWGTGWLADDRRDRVLGGVPFLGRPLAEIL